MKQILAYGDSNTWGLVPGTQQRYPWQVRWTGLLQQMPCCGDVRILEEGLCGRTTVFEDALRRDRRGVDLLPVLLESHGPLDGAILMLGTNDCKTAYRASAFDIGVGIRDCLSLLREVLPARQILLISPILLGEDVWRADKDPDFSPGSVRVCRQLKEEYATIARQSGCGFLAASDFAEPSDVDDEHLTPEGHAALARAIAQKLQQMQLL